MVSASFTLMSDAKEALKVRLLDQVPYICYPVQFRKDNGKNVLALLNSESEVNAMTPAYAAQLDLKVRRTNVNAQKIDGSLQATYGIVIAAFQVFDMLGRSWFFQKTFLLANISMEVVLGIPFLTFSNAYIQFVKKELIWKTYTTKEVLPITCRVEFINRKEFGNVVLDKNIGAFVVYVSFLGSRMTIHLARKA